MLHWDPELMFCLLKTIKIIDTNHVKYKVTPLLFVCEMLKQVRGKFTEVQIKKQNKWLMTNTVITLYM